MTWNDIASNEIEGKVFCTWSASGKARNVDFAVDCVDDAGITFRKQSGRTQRVSRSAAENVFANWEGYKAGHVSRAELAVNNFSTSYLFGVLKTLEDLSQAKERST